MKPKPVTRINVDNGIFFLPRRRCYEVRISLPHGKSINKSCFRDMLAAMAWRDETRAKHGLPPVLYHS